MRRLASAPTAFAPLNNFFSLELLTADECAVIVAAAEAHGGWRLRGEHHGHLTNDCAVDSIPALRWVTERAAALAPALVGAYGVEEPRLDALRIVRYEADGLSSLALHSDGAALSFVCALDSDSGGGTYVRVLRQTFRPDAGHALLFCGRWMHAGAPVRRGALRYVLTGFFEVSGADDHLARIAEAEARASVAPHRTCQRGWFLSREFASGDGETRACSCCRAAVAACAVRHRCECGCGVALCDQCVPTPPPVEPTENESYCEFVADITLSDGSRVDGGSTIRKIWRLTLSGAPVRLVRCDFDADEAIRSRCLPIAEQRDDGTVDAVCELVAPTRPGVYRVFFALLSAGSGERVGGCDELFADFFVGDAAGWRRNLLRHRYQLGAAYSRSWEAPPAAGCTLVIAFAGADAALAGRVKGGVPSRELSQSLSRAGAGAAIFVRDALRSWYLRGVGDDGHDFASVVDTLRREVAAVRPNRVVTLGCSMGGYAALRAAIEMGADLAIAFAPQVVLEPDERRRLALPPMVYDHLLEGVANAGEAEGFALMSLIACVAERGRRATRTELEVHVGELCAGDCAEAELFAAAVAAAEPEANLACAVVRHPRRGHRLAGEMRESGELHELLRRAVGDGAAEQGLPESYVGFEGCDDF